MKLIEPHWETTSHKVFTEHSFQFSSHRWLVRSMIWVEHFDSEYNDCWKFRRLFGRVISFFFYQTVDNEFDDCVCVCMSFL